MSTKSAKNIPRKFMSRKQADKITDPLLTQPENSDEYLSAFMDAQQWRAQHALATENCFRALLEASTCFPDAVLTFRLKRMKSILAKIKRPGKHYGISTMEDIGGCRIILDDMKQVEYAID